MILIKNASSKTFTTGFRSAPNPDLAPKPDPCYNRRMSADCVFCKITQHQIPAKIVWENAQVVAFQDINPQAPVHVVLVPKTHIARMIDLNESNVSVMKDLILSANELAKNLKIADGGYRLVINCNSAGGQTVYHLHLHLLGGRQMHWPPG